MISVLFGILVITSKNPIVSVLFLISLFVSIALYLMMLGLNFIGLSYLLVYVGAVSILFLFILMLINIRVSELSTNNSNSIPLAIIITVFVTGNQFFPKAIGMPIMNTGGFTNSITEITTAGGKAYEYIGFETNYVKIRYYLDELFTATSSSWDMSLSETFHITTIGNIIYTNYPIWLILTSIILLLAMIGSILITIKQ